MYVLMKKALLLLKGDLVVKRRSTGSRRLFATALTIVIVALPYTVRADSALGFGIGMNLDSDNFLVGAQAELGRAFQAFRFAPSLDVELGDNNMTALNLDLRLYLFSLPETGLYFYGAAGPTIVFDSPGAGDGGTEAGLSLVTGVKIPMKGQNRYNFEARFGVGDIPDLKLVFGILFGI
jgi:hypothetical protein